jgi:uncharacterized protein (DUF2062 family)
MKTTFNIQFCGTKSAHRPILGNSPKTKKWWGRRLQYVILKSLRDLIHLDETPYRIAMGCACGIFSSALPIFGQTFIGMILARLLNASVISSLPWTWISNPVTTLPMWYGGYRLGVWLLSKEEIILSYAEIGGLIQEFDTLNWTQELSLMSDTLWNSLLPLWLGTSVIGMAMAIPGFFVVYYLVAWRQRYRKLKRER